MRPIYLFENNRLAEWTQRERPEWVCRSWWNYPLGGLRTDRLVIVLPVDGCSGHEFHLRLQRIKREARLRLTPGGRLMVVTARGLPVTRERL